MNKENVKTEKPFTQVCVWPQCFIYNTKMSLERREKKIKEFEQFMLKDFNARVKFLEQITTFPDKVNGTFVEGTGGSICTFFVVHSDDLGHFAVPRLTVGIRWVEDVIDNEDRRGNGSIYPERIKQYRTW